MPCYIHRYTGTMPGCLDCGAHNAFFGGFAVGIYRYPINLLKGIGGADRDQVVVATKELQLLRALIYRRESLSDDRREALRVYGSLPTGIRNGVELGALEGMGGLAAGMMMSSLIAAFTGRGIANFVGARLGPRHAVFARTPATIMVSGLLSYFSIVASTINFVEPQRRVLQARPDVQAVFDEALDLANKSPDKPGKD